MVLDRLCLETFGISLEINPILLTLGDCWTILDLTKGAVITDRMKRQTIQDAKPGSSICQSITVYFGSDSEKVRVHCCLVQGINS